MDDQVVCAVTHQACICCSSPGVRASCCGRSSLRGRLSPSAASPLWGPASERLPPPGPPHPRRTRGPRWHRCSAAPSAGHSDSGDGSCAKQISCHLCASLLSFLRVQVSSLPLALQAEGVHAKQEDLSVSQDGGEAGVLRGEEDRGEAVGPNTGTQKPAAPVLGVQDGQVLLNHLLGLLEE